MVLGFLLYEAVDLAWKFGGMTYRGVKNVYNWYYEVPTPDEIEIRKLGEIDKRMRHIENILANLTPNQLEKLSIDVKVLKDKDE